MKRYFLLALLCFASSLLGSAVTVAFLSEPPVESEQDEWKLPDVLRVSRIELIDTEGRTRLELAANPADSDARANMIALYDVNGVRKLTAGMNEKGYPFLTLQNSELPNPEHKRIALTLQETTATLQLGHGDLSEIELQSARPADTVESRIQLRARNSSIAAFYVDDYGRATFEVRDNSTKSLIRIPQQRESVLD